jgi:hypothetical protein
MNRLFGIALVMYVLGDPDLSLLAGLSVSKDYVVAIALALITVPWVTSQFDN